MKIEKWRYDTEKDGIYFLLDNGEEIELSLELFSEIVVVIPAFDEEKQIRSLLKEIYEVEKRRVLLIEEIDKQIETLMKEHEKVRGELDASPTKTEIFAINGKIKSLASQKTMLGERRHLVKALFQKEMDLRARLAKIRAGRSEE